MTTFLPVPARAPGSASIRTSRRAARSARRAGFLLLTSGLVFGGLPGLGAPVSLSAQAPSAQPAQSQAQAQGLSQAEAAQAALATALLEVEYALRGRPPASSELAALNQAFDRATLAFFGGQVDVVVSAMAELADRIEPDPAIRAEQAARTRARLAELPALTRVLEGRHPPVPWRLAGPAPPAGDGVDAERRWPVVVALHGAGGNEHMFMEAYGAGRLPELAEELGFVVISPGTMAMGTAPGALPRLLDAAEAELGLALDRDRVFLIGHSMGAGMASRLVEAAVDTPAAQAGDDPARTPLRIRAVACLAGPCGPGTSGSYGAWPPLLLVGGGLDPLAPPARLEAAAEGARARGLEVELRILPTQGHTLLVGAVMEDVVQWLLAQG